MTVDVAVVGAGPYGLSIAAHLRARGVNHRSFGPPMYVWRNQMPQGMFLKSDGFASDLYDPSSAFRLGDYCAAKGLPYADLGLPIQREVFADYGLEFQRRFVPDHEPVNVTSIEEAAQGFSLTLETGETLTARRVVLAVGISHFANMPTELAALPRTLVSHSSQHPDLAVFSGKDVVVLGAGASAMDCAVLLANAGASVRLTARAPRISYHEPPSKRPRTMMQRLLVPNSGLGPGWKPRLAADLPRVFHALPERFRLYVVRKSLPPAPGWWIRSMAEGKIQFHLSTRLTSATEEGGRLKLMLTSSAGEKSTIIADHLISATGYHPDIQRLQFLSATLRDKVRTAGDAPVLSSNFESSVRGLYFVGLAAANSFGPVLRFAFGAGFASRRLARHLDRHRVTQTTRQGHAEESLLADAA